VIVRNADGTVDHDGEFNPWLELDTEREKECRATGGFVMRIGIAHLGRSRIVFNENGEMSIHSEPTRHKGDGLMYVSFS